MKTYFQRSAAEQELITKAYEFEVAAIEAESYERNPYFEALKALGLWEAVNEALELRFSGVNP